MDTAKLSAIGLGNMIMNMVPFALMMGVNTAIETLFSQALGRQNLQECGIYSHKACFIIIVLFVPVSASFFYMSELSPTRIDRRVYYQFKLDFTPLKST